jgi:hypothetical protein
MSSNIGSFFSDLPEVGTHDDAVNIYDLADTSAYFKRYEVCELIGDNHHSTMRTKMIYAIGKGRSDKGEDILFYFSEMLEGQTIKEGYRDVRSLLLSRVKSASLLESVEEK